MERKIKYTVLTLEQKETIIKYKEENRKASNDFIAGKFGRLWKLEIKRKTVDNIIKNKEKIRKDLLSNKKTSKRASKVKFEKIENAMVLYMDYMESKGTIITDFLMKIKAQEIANKLGETEFKNSNGWLEKFKARHDYRLSKLYGETYVEEGPIDYSEFKKSFMKKLEEFGEDNVYNMDETGIFFKLIPEKSVCKKMRPGYKKYKDRISLALCCNFSGTKKLKPLIIGRATKPRCFKDFNVEKFVEYTNSKRAWMTGIIFKSWLESLNRKLIKKNEKILLLIDNCTSHNINKTFSNIELMYLPKNSTGILQPMDRGIIQNFKVKFNKYKLSYITDKIENGMHTTEAFKKLNIKDAIVFADLAWNEVKQETMKNCFKHLKNIEIQDEILEETKNKNSDVYDLFLKKAEIIDPVSEKEYIEITYTENDEIILEAEEYIDNNPLISLKESEEEIITSNEKNSSVKEKQEKISEESFNKSLETIQKYFETLEDFNLPLYQLHKDVIKFQKARREEYKKRGIIGHFQYMKFLKKK